MHTLPRNWIPLHHNNIARPQSQNITGHRLELVVRNFDERPSALGQILDELDRHEREVDHGQAVIHGTDERHQVETLPRPVIVSQVIRHHRHPERLQDLLELPDSFPVGAIAAANGERPLIDPERISALDRSRRLNLSQNGHADLHIRPGMEGNFVDPLGLARPEQDRPFIRHQRRVVAEDGIHVSWLVSGSENDFCPTGDEELDERRMFLNRTLMVDRVEVRQIAPFRVTAGWRRLPHHHPAQRLPKGMTSVSCFDRQLVYRHSVFSSTFAGIGHNPGNDTQPGGTREPMPTVVFDPYSGASGDMVLGAMVDLGLPIDALTEHLRMVLPSGWNLSTETVERNSVHGTRVRIPLDDGQPPRDWRAVRTLIEGSRLPETMKARALAIFERVARAEAKVHQTPIDQVHFHEVGAVDSIVDICGAAIAFDLLGIDRAFTLPVRTGQGFVATSHGLLPVPAPATLEIIAASGLTVSAPGKVDADVRAELLTPTGAAILGTLATPIDGAFVPQRVGYGFGTYELPWPNALRVVFCMSDPVPPPAGEVLLETNIDDMNPQGYELLMERLYVAGALEVWMTPVLMKKSRPAVVLSLLAPSNLRQPLEEIILRNSTSLGVRTIAVDRTKADRSFEQVSTRFGDVMLKLKLLDGRVIAAVPEYEDCLALARGSDAPFSEVWNEAHRMGERFVGRQSSD